MHGYRVVTQMSECIWVWNGSVGCQSWLLQQFSRPALIVVVSMENNKKVKKQKKNDKTESTEIVVTNNLDKLCTNMVNKLQTALIVADSFYSCCCCCCRTLYQLLMCPINNNLFNSIWLEQANKSLQSFQLLDQQKVTLVTLV